MGREELEEAIEKKKEKEKRERKRKKKGERKERGKAEREWRLGRGRLRLGGGKLVGDSSFFGACVGCFWKFLLWENNMLGMAKNPLHLKGDVKRCSLFFSFFFFFVELLLFPSCLRSFARFFFPLPFFFEIFFLITP